MEKQIEEINEIIASKICESYSPICDEWQPHDCGKCYANDTHISEISETIYNAGYRKQEWISVEERLPAEDVRVLVWLRKDHKTTYTRIDTDRRLNGVWVRWYESVTHWMPLPEPPKGE